MLSSKRAFTAAMAAIVALPLLAACSGNVPDANDVNAMPPAPVTATFKKLSDMPSDAYDDGVRVITVKGSEVGRDKDVHCIVARLSGDSPVMSCDWFAPVPKAPGM